MRSLSEYSLIGNCRSAALVSKHGSIDWCCLPEFHSPAIFSALLDKNRGGHFSITPVHKYQSCQQYINNTNVVETCFTTDAGKVVVRDAFAVTTEENKTLALFPDHEILRVVECISGSVRLRMDFAPSCYYGKFGVRMQNNQAIGIKFFWKENTYVLLSTLKVEQVVVLNNSAVSEFEIEAGGTIIFSFSCSGQNPAVLPELAISGLFRMTETIDYWKSWISQCSYKGMYEGWVKRSALVLKLLTHAPSGAIIAAPTTSLPEEIGGERNWDYRYCWLRDASFTVRALLKLGFEQEVHAYMNWILHATQLTRPRLQVVYSVFGKARLKESVLNWLDGFENSKPVRTGNGAYNQHQLDVYGEVLDACFSYATIINEFDSSSRRFMLGLGDVICKLWNEPDSGIWEIRSELVHHTHSKVMAWVGLDRLIKMARKYKWKNANIDRYEKVKAAIREQVEHYGYNAPLGSYTRELGGAGLDASVLVFPLVEYCDVSSPRMMSTVKTIYKHLSKNDFVYRYRNTEDGLRGEEGCFGICSFWLAENFALSGNVEGAVRIFDNMVRHAGSTGLFAEEIDPESHELLGNYPQGFTHIGLINAALSINEVYKKGGLPV